MYKIAILLTCFNRKEKTLNCLNHIYNLGNKENFFVDIFLVDGGSTDGTPSEVSRFYPEVHIEVAEGLYWAGGMRKAWNNALSKGGYDYFWLINDDTSIYPDCLNWLLKADEYCIAKYGKHGIYTGCTKSPLTGELTYGAKMLQNKSKLKGKLVIPSDNDYLECDLCNGNILLVPKEVYDVLGILNPQYIHGIADWDYSLRAKREGIPVLVAPGYLGECERDHGKGYLPQSCPLKKRIEFLHSPKGLAYEEFMCFTKEFFPKDYYPQKIKFWVKTIFPFIYDIINMIRK